MGVGLGQYMHTSWYLGHRSKVGVTISKILLIVWGTHFGQKYIPFWLPKVRKYLGPNAVGSSFLSNNETWKRKVIFQTLWYCTFVHSKGQDLKLGENHENPWKFPYRRWSITLRSCQLYQIYESLKNNAKIPSICFRL